MLFHREPAKRGELADGLQMIEEGVARLTWVPMTQQTGLNSHSDSIWLASFLQSSWIYFEAPNPRYLKVCNRAIVM